MITRPDWLVLAAMLTRRAVQKARDAEKAVKRTCHPKLVEKIRQDAVWAERMAVEINAMVQVLPEQSGWCPHCERAGGYHAFDCPAAAAAQYHNGMVRAAEETEFNDDLPF